MRRAELHYEQAGMWDHDDDLAMVDRQAATLREAAIQRANDLEKLEARELAAHAAAEQGEKTRDLLSVRNGWNRAELQRLIGDHGSLSRRQNRRRCPRLESEKRRGRRRRRLLGRRPRLRGVVLPLRKTLESTRRRRLPRETGSSRSGWARTAAAVKRPAIYYESHNSSRILLRFLDDSWALTGLSGGMTALHAATMGAQAGVLEGGQPRTSADFQVNHSQPVAHSTRAERGEKETIPARRSI